MTGKERQAMVGVGKRRKGIRSSLRKTEVPGAGGVEPGRPRLEAASRGWGLAGARRGETCARPGMDGLGVWT